VAKDRRVKTKSAGLADSSYYSEKRAAEPRLQRPGFLGAEQAERPWGRQRGPGKTRRRLLVLRDFQPPEHRRRRTTFFRSLLADADGNC